MVIILVKHIEDQAIKALISRDQLGIEIQVPKIKFKMITKL